MRIVVLTGQSLPSNLITATLMREMPGRVVGMVLSAGPDANVSKPVELWRRFRRRGLIAIVGASRGVEVRMLWRLRRSRPGSTLPPDVRELAAAAGVPLVRTSDVNSADTRAAVQALAPDLLVSIYFPRRIRREIRAVAGHGAINVHPALLPKHRGPFPGFWLVAAGERRSAVTVHWIDDGLDTGDILLQHELEVPAGASVATVTGMVARPTAKALVEAVGLIEAGEAPRHPQDHSAASYETWPEWSDLVGLWRRGGRYGSAFEMVRACEQNE